MSLEATIPKAASLNNLSKNHTNSQQQQYISEGDCTAARHGNQSTHKSSSNSKHSSDKTGVSKLQKRASKSTRSARSQLQTDSARADQSSGSSHCSSKQRTQRQKRPSACHSLVERILYTVGELEHTLIEDHQHDYKLRIALEQQTDKIDHLRCSLENEKQRNQRLVQLIRGVDSSSSTGDETENMFNTYRLTRDGGKGTGCWQSRSSIDAFDSISPLLMQQRYDELSMSHKQCQRQLAKREKLLTLTKCGKEELQSKYEHLLDEYRSVQQHFEEMCCKYLRLQSKKNQEIQKLRDALTYASDCVISAQNAMDCRADGDNANHYDLDFRQNLQLFIKALRLCEWVQYSCNRASIK